MNYFKLPENGIEGLEEHAWHKDYGNVRIIGMDSNGGYATEEACNRLTLNTNMTASFSRALSEGLYADQYDDLFNGVLSENINNIVKASEVH